MPYRQMAEEVLARWREAERRLMHATAEEQPAILAEIEKLRATYQDLIEQARAAHRPEPPPFPYET
jgi:hypothetical protein